MRREEQWVESLVLLLLSGGFCSLFTTFESFSFFRLRMKTTNHTLTHTHKLSDGGSNRTGLDRSASIRLLKKASSF